MNASNPNPAATEAPQTETAYLWHELREAQAREAVLGEASYNLVRAVQDEFENNLPHQIQRKIDQVAAALPQDLRRRLRLTDQDDDEGGRMSKANKWVLGITGSLMAGLLIWAYVVTYVL